MSEDFENNKNSTAETEETNNSWSDIAHQSYEPTVLSPKHGSKDSLDNSSEKDAASKIKPPADREGISPKDLAEPSPANKPSEQDRLGGTTDGADKVKPPANNDAALTGDKTANDVNKVIEKLNDLLENGGKAHPEFKRTLTAAIGDANRDGKLAEFEKQLNQELEKQDMHMDLKVEKGKLDVKIWDQKNTIKDGDGKPVPYLHYKIDPNALDGKAPDGVRIDESVRPPVGGPVPVEVRPAPKSGTNPAPKFIEFSNPFNK